MALVQPLDKTVKIMVAVNEGKESEALSALGLNSKSDLGANELFLNKICGLSSIYENTYPGGLLATPDTKKTSIKDIASVSMDINYALAESVSMVSASSVSSFGLLCEDNGSTPLFNDTEMKNIEFGLTEGLSVIKDALTNVFTGIATLNKKARKIFGDILDENNIYATLIPNAISGANILFNISKLNKYTSSNKTNLNESMNVANVTTKFSPDTMLFGVLNLQENLINTYRDIAKFDTDVACSLNEDNSEMLKTVKDYIDGALKCIAVPICEGKMGLKNEELKSAFNFAITNISALYDQYLQDLASC